MTRKKLDDIYKRNTVITLRLTDIETYILENFKVLLRELRTQYKDILKEIKGQGSYCIYVK